MRRAVRLRVIHRGVIVHVLLMIGQNQAVERHFGAFALHYGCGIVANDATAQIER